MTNKEFNTIVVVNNTLSFTKKPKQFPLPTVDHKPSARAFHFCFLTLIALSLSSVIQRIRVPKKTSTSRHAPIWPTINNKAKFV